MDTCRLGDRTVVLTHNFSKYPSNEKSLSGMTLFVGHEDSTPTVEVYLTHDELVKLKVFLNQVL